MRLPDKVIIVTGGTSGIGKAIVERAVAEGAQVLVHGIERRDGEALVAQLGSKAALHLDDLVDPASPGRIAAAALAAFGRIDAVVNNAAIVARSNLESTTPAFFDRMIAGGATPRMPTSGSFLTTQELNLFQDWIDQGVQDN